MRRVAPRPVFALLVACLGLLGASLGAASCKEPPPQVTETPTPPPSGPAPEASLRAGGSPLVEHDLWKMALESPEDTTELARLAEDEGATGLLRGLAEGGATALVALAALPWAEDAEIATPQLAQLLRSSDLATLGPVLDSLEGIALRPRTQTEPLNPLGSHACFDALVELSRQGKAPAALRARAVSVARLFAARGPYDLRLLPTDFDRLRGFRVT